MHFERRDARCAVAVIAMSGLYGYRWQASRLRFLQAHPLCSMCEARGIIAAATVVDHILPHKGDPALFWNVENWQPLCKACHDSRKQMLEQPGKVPPHASWTGRGEVGKTTATP